MISEKDFDKLKLLDDEPSRFNISYKNSGMLLPVKKKVISKVPSTNRLGYSRHRFRRLWRSRFKRRGSRMRLKGSSLSSFLTIANIARNDYTFFKLPFVFEAAINNIPVAPNPIPYQINMSIRDLMDNNQQWQQTMLNWMVFKPLSIRFDFITGWYSRDLEPDVKLPYEVALTKDAAVPAGYTYGRETHLIPVNANQSRKTLHFKLPVNVGYYNTNNWVGIQAGEFGRLQIYNEYVIRNRGVQALAVSHPFDRDWETKNAEFF